VFLELRKRGPLVELQHFRPNYSLPIIGSGLFCHKTGL